MALRSIRPLSPHFRRHGHSERPSLRRDQDRIVERREEDGLLRHHGELEPLGVSFFWSAVPRHRFSQPQLAAAAGSELPAGKAAASRRTPYQAGRWVTYRPYRLGGRELLHAVANGVRILHLVGIGVAADCLVEEKGERSEEHTS